jgi:hypothetical protein
MAGSSLEEVINNIDFPTNIISSSPVIIHFDTVDLLVTDSVAKETIQNVIS